MSIVRRRIYECLKTWRCKMKGTWIIITSHHKFWSTIRGADPSGPRDLRLWSAAVRLSGLRVRIPPVSWMFVSCECCVLSRRGYLRRAHYSSRGVLSSVVCLRVFEKIHRGGPGPLGAVGLWKRVHGIIWLCNYSRAENNIYQIVWL
jgi:hypothetical protein